ncbi:hypothetical protein [Parashewanella tropica]|uniref:hypothetical protein n=1 Tax=Parashewanella tropica TaxID=2547970 RepID=UPI001059BA68|nr:hypothetical protein [Parashewanella tropica]
MNKLMRASNWAKREFCKDSIPDGMTLKRWVERGVIKGRIVDGKTYVFDSEHAGLDTDVSKVVKNLLSA